MGQVRLTQAGHLPLCDCCGRPLTADDVDDEGYTEPADCCDRVALCADCRPFGGHDCDE
jgi:hypothetical protein